MPIALHNKEGKEGGREGSVRTKLGINLSESRCLLTKQLAVGKDLSGSLLNFDQQWKSIAIELRM